MNIGQYQAFLKQREKALSFEKLWEMSDTQGKLRLCLGRYCIVDKGGHEVAKGRMEFYGFSINDKWPLYTVGRETFPEQSVRRFDIEPNGIVIYLN